MSSARILLVDDDEEFARITLTRLRRAGYEADFHLGGFGSVNFARAKKYAMVILDVAMPGLGGDGLVGLFRRLPELDELKILFLSSQDADALRDLTKKTGADGWITKSASGSELVRKIQTLLR